MARSSERKAQVSSFKHHQLIPNFKAILCEPDSIHLLAKLVPGTASLQLLCINAPIFGMQTNHLELFKKIHSTQKAWGDT